MLRFLRWRKMTWAIFIWTGAMVAFVVRGLTTADADCKTNFGPSGDFVSKQECLSVASAESFGRTGITAIAVVWLFGLILLTALWFETRPLWRQGRELRFRRLRSVNERAPKDYSKLTESGHGA